MSILESSFAFTYIYIYILTFLPQLPIYPCSYRITHCFHFELASTFPLLYLTLSHCVSYATSLSPSLSHPLALLPFPAKPHKTLKVPLLFNGCVQLLLGFSCYKCHFFYLLLLLLLRRHHSRCLAKNNSF